MGLFYASPTSDYSTQQAIFNPNATPRTMDAALDKYKKQQEQQTKEKNKKKTKKEKPPVDTNASQNSQPAPAQPDNQYKWNLPPHQWSLPVKPQYMNELVNNIISSEKYRRGRMWWYASNVQDFVQSDGSTKKATLDRKYGFQFLWNPDSYSTNIQLNMDSGPTPSDRFVGVAGAFPSGEAISFTLRLDRTNDFACMRSLLAKNYTVDLVAGSAAETLQRANIREGRVDTTTLSGVLAASAIDPAIVKSTNPNVFKEMTKYYKSSFSADVGEDDLLKQISDLMNYGTVADVEYLYKAINGGGWQNKFGRETSDIGFLSATLLRIDVGPLSYLGFVNSLGINHLAFNEDMTPIRTDVQVSMNLMATAGLVSAENTPGAVSPTP